MINVKMSNSMHRKIKKILIATKILIINWIKKISIIKLKIVIWMKLNLNQIWILLWIKFKNINEKFNLFLIILFILCPYSIIVYYEIYFKDLNFP